MPFVTSVLWRCAEHGEVLTLEIVASFYKKEEVQVMK